MDLMDRARELGTEADSWVKIAFNEILGSIYACELKEGELDKLIEDMAYYAMEKLDIKEEDFNWQSIEEWQTKEQYSLANYYLDFSEVKKIVEYFRRFQNIYYRKYSPTGLLRLCAIYSFLLDVLFIYLAL